MVDCIAPRPGELICDPACGTGGFPFAAHQYLAQHDPKLTRDEKRHLKVRTTMTNWWPATRPALGIVRIEDEYLAGRDNLPPEVSAREIVDDLEAAIEPFRLMASVDRRLSRIGDWVDVSAGFTVHADACVAAN